MASRPFNQNSKRQESACREAGFSCSVSGRQNQKFELPFLSGTGFMKHQGFARVELLITLLTVALLGALGVSVCADTRERSQRIQCLDNQRMIGRAFGIFAADHGGTNPWRVPQSAGGTSVPTGPFIEGAAGFPASISQNVWFQYWWVRDDLPSPSVLLCPSDPGKRPASNFSTAPGGLAHIAMQNNAVSYVIGLDTYRDRPSIILAADRNLIMSPGVTGCSSGIVSARSIRTDPPGANGWTNSLHVNSGNVLFDDGRVEQFTTPELNAYLTTTLSLDDNGVFHLLPP